MLKRYLTIVLGAAACASGISASAATSTVSPADRMFAMKAAQGGMAEIAAAGVAQKNSTNPVILAFAKKMIADHSMAGKKLAAIAKQNGMMLPMSMAPADVKMRATMEAMHGVDFDHAYLRGQRMGHAKMAALFEQEAATGSNPALVAFSKATLPTVKEHLALVTKDMKMKSGGMMKSSM